MIYSPPKEQPWFCSFLAIPYNTLCVHTHSFISPDPHLGEFPELCFLKSKSTMYSDKNGLVKRVKVVS